MSARYTPRSSVRSRGSSSTTGSDPREKVKDCCRKLIAFMCTQVGVGGLIVCYAIVGAFSFIQIETTSDQNPRQIQFEKVQVLRENCSSDLWQVTAAQNVFNRTHWTIQVNETLRKFQIGFVEVVKSGYDARKVDEVWSFPAALMFCLSIFTMIGYGNTVPQTAWGKGTTVLYAVFGIPLYVLYFMNMGEVLAQSFRWVYRWLYECSNPVEQDQESGMPRPRKRIIVPSTACLWVIGGYVLTGAIMFAEWEGWNYLDSTYFCVTSLCKIGFGDFVPGANINESKSGKQTKLVINFVYMLVGMGIVAMCYNLMREEIRIKVREMREDLGQCLEDVRLRFVACGNKCHRTKDEDE